VQKCDGRPLGLFLQGKVFSFWGFAPDPWPWALSLHFSGYGLQTPNIIPNTSIHIPQNLWCLEWIKHSLVAIGCDAIYSTVTSHERAGKRLTWEGCWDDWFPSVTPPPSARRVSQL